MTPPTPTPVPCRCEAYNPYVWQVSRTRWVVYCTCGRSGPEADSPEAACEAWLVFTTIQTLEGT